MIENTMKTMSNGSVWYSRWQVVQQTMETSIATIQSKRTLPRQTTLLNTFKCLNVFGERQFNFLFNGFYGDRHYLEPSPRYPADYVLRATLDQIAFDVTVLQRAWHQRQLGSDGEKNALHKADILADQALQLACQAGLIRPATALTYFQKVHTARVIPYAPVALLAVPLSCATNYAQLHSRDFLAIYHEVGHYVYRHGMVNGERIPVYLANQFYDRPVWVQDWLEEIFADVFGGLMAGPLIALDFQELQSDNPAEQFMEDDGIHPIPAIRPQIYLKVLEKRRGKDVVWKKLEENWDLIVKKRGDPKQFRPRSGYGEWQKIKDTREHVLEVAETIADRLMEYLPGDFFLYEQMPAQPSLYQEALSNLPDNSPSANSGIELPALYQLLEQILAQPTEGKKAQEFTLEGTAHRVGTWAEHPGVGKTGLWTDMLIDQYSQEIATPERNSIPSEVWALILSTQGWCVKGPENDQMPKVG